MPTFISVTFFVVPAPRFERGLLESNPMSLPLAEAGIVGTGARIRIGVCGFGDRRLNH